MPPGFINAGGSLGQFVFAPLVQLAIVGLGWVNAMLTLAAAMLTTLPLAWPLRRREPAAHNRGARGRTARRPGTCAAAARRRRATRAIGGSISASSPAAFTSRFSYPPAGRGQAVRPVAVDLANSLAIIGIANIAGSLGAGWLGGRYRMKHLLFWIYLLRAAAVLGCT